MVIKPSVLFSIILFLTTLCPIKGQNKTFTTTQIKADMHYLHTQLKANHPNLYLYSSKTEIDAFMDSLYRNMPESMTELEFYKLVTPLSNKIKDGHTLFFPSLETLNAFNADAEFFPFKIYWDGAKMFVELNYSGADEIENGSEILSINGTAASEIINTCVSRMMHDGDNQTYPIWVLNNWFNEYYSYFYGHPQTFDIKYQTEKGDVQIKKITALKKPTIFANRAKRYPNRTFSRTNGQKKGDGLVLKIDKEKKLATLTIKDFDSDILRKTYKQNFKKTITQYFKQIETAGITHLILDIRNNQGGDIEYAECLLSFLINTPFKIVEQYFVVDKPNENTEIKRNKLSSGQALGIIQPKTAAFKGQLVTLINGGSFSNSGIVASALQFYKRGLIIGEESGGNKHIICGYENSFVLPHTQIKVDIPTRQFEIRERAKNVGRGIMPDTLINPSIAEMIKGHDEILDFAIESVLKM